MFKITFGTGTFGIPRMDLPKIPLFFGFRTSIARRSSAVSQDVHEIALEISDIQDR